MKTQVSKESLLNYFAGHATALQKQLIDEWARDEQNQEFFFDCLTLWERQNMQFNADVHQALERHHQRMAHESLPEIEPARLDEPVLRSFTSSTWFGWVIAASVSGILLLAGIAFKDQLRYTTYRTAFGEIRTINLSDGSRVTLNANSVLRVPRFGFGKETRDVMLSGEADFSIQHMADNQRFVVQTGKNFDVVVLGTEFMVNTRDRSKKVVLNKGKVQLLYQEGTINKQLTMKPGNLVTFDQKGHVNLKQTPKSQDFLSWKDHRFVFENTTLSELSSLFKENYGIQLQFTDTELTQWTISGAFTASSAEELLETLASTSNLTYRRQGNTIIITQEPKLN